MEDDKKMDHITTHQFGGNVMDKIVRHLIADILFIVLIVGMIACVHNTADNDNPEVLYQKDHDIDMLVYDRTAYVNAANNEWVVALDLKKDQKIGEIKRTNVTKNYKDFDATFLNMGTEVYSVSGRKDILLVNINNKLIPYLIFVEG